MVTKKIGDDVLSTIMHPLGIKFRAKDVLQVMIGAAILAVPVGFTEETWKLGESLPILNVVALLALSLIFVSSFVYYHYHKNGGEHSRESHISEFTKRVLTTYILSFVVVAVLLMIIQKAPWGTDALLAFKRTVIVTFPSSMRAAVADVIK